MKAIHRVLTRTLVKEFYRANAGFFLLIAGVMFGFLRIPEHEAIAAALANNPIYYLVPFGLWSLYSIKTLSFCFTAKRLPANWFLTDLNLLANSKRKPLVLYIQLLLLIPILGYSAFLAYMAFQQGQVNSAIMVITGNLLILLASGHLLHAKLILPIDSSIGNKFRNWTSILPKWYSIHFIHHLFQRHGLTLITNKLFSIGIILGATAIFRVEGIDLRYLALGMLLSSAPNAGFSFRHQEFEMHSLKIFRNLPTPKLSLFWKDCLTYLMLSTPELLVLFGNNLMDIPMFQLVQIGLLLPVLLMLHRTVMLTSTKDMEQFMKYVFFASAIIFFIIMGHIEPIIIEAIALITGLTLYLKLSRRQE